MIGADGEIDDDEFAIVRRIDGAGMTNAWKQALDAWKRIDRPSDCVAIVVPGLTETQRQFIFVNLVDIAMADGHLAGAEKALLERYVEALELDDSFVTVAVDIIATKNDRAPFPE
jgi:uncharacterized membrane protein YebE (DUF533 family)